MLIRLSACFLLLLALSVPLSDEVLADQPWPMDRQVDLSSGFGDFRDGRFHAGIDFRTGGRIGSPVNSPVNGWVSRLKMSYYGYGKAIYITGDDGYLYVFAHLSRLSPKIDQVVKATQRRSKRYFVDFQLPRDSIRVELGEFIANSGQSGVGAPHLHFEKRTGNNIPLNPLLHGFDLNDPVRPTLKAVHFQMIDDRSVFGNGRRRFSVPVSSIGPGKYRADSLVLLNRPFGLLVEGYDKMRADGMKQSVMTFEFFLNDELFYRMHSDSLDYDYTKYANLEYDYISKVRDKKTIRRLFKLPGNDFPGSGGVHGRDGRLGEVPLKAGRHSARIVAADASGNKSVLEFDFLWWPEETLFELDSLQTLANGDSTIFYLSGPDGVDSDTPFDSVVALRNIDDLWAKPRNVEIIRDSDSKYRCIVDGYGASGAVLRAHVFVEDCVIPDLIFSGIQAAQPDRSRIVHEVVDDGLLVQVLSKHKTGSEGRILFYKGDDLLGSERLIYMHMGNHVAFVPPRPEYRHVDRIGVSMSAEERRVTVFSDSLALFCAGFDKSEELRYDEFFAIRTGKDNFYTPRWLELKGNRTPKRAQLQLVSNHYQILPEQFVTARPFDVELVVPGRDLKPIPSGLCKLDKKKDEWAWLSEETEGDTLRATSKSGGSFAGVQDGIEPMISRLSVIEGKTYPSKNFSIRFKAEDDKSGIYDDQDIYIKLDGQWLIPEYDPESNVCHTRPYELLARGSHHLEITLYDRAGNKTAKYLDFFISDQKPRGNQGGKGR